MTIRFDCDECGTSLKVRDEKAGRKTRCPSCNAVLQVPEVDADSDWELDQDIEEIPASKSKRDFRTSEGSQVSRFQSRDTSLPLPAGRKKKSTKNTQSDVTGGGVPVWAQVVGACILGMLSFGVGGLLGLNYGNAAGLKNQATNHQVAN